ncbi:hypothetical protein RJ640_008975 [Escallonia rubra]|uniref:Uncharacterized protein n=1 Tax=Escallonia rubra TaxID=112253 RepID=A0AA88UQ77_9ASTE|nr:hypothetical protein RJ640_008975 [Escallonia rubra]
MDVQILSSEFIKPSAPTTDEKKNYKVTFFEQLAPKMHIPLVYFFSFEGQDTVENAGKQEKLKKSLSETLTVFYPLAGRFANDGLSVNCRDQGVLYYVAKANVELAEFFSEVNKNLDLLNDYFPRDIGAYNSSTTPLVAVQVTTFECGGVAVAVSSSHAIADGFTGCTFISDWAAMSKLGTIKPLNYERSGFPTKNRDGIKPPRGWKTGAKYVTKKFLFDGSAVSSLKAKVAPKVAHHPSKVEVTMACIWRGLICASRAIHGDLRPSVMSLTMNLRGRTPMHIPSDSFGNCYIEFPIKFMGEEDKMELHDLVALVRDAKKNTIAECEKASNPDELFSLVFENLKEVREIMHDDKVDFYYLSSLCRFPLYQADFGWGKPCFITGDSVPAEMVALKDTECGTGIEAKVSVTEADMLGLEADPDVDISLAKERKKEGTAKGFWGGVYTRGQKKSQHN